MIGQLCTCDVENFGDILYPIVFRKLAEKHGITSAIVPLGFFPGPAPCEAGYDVQGINDVLSSPGQTLSHLVIGGGDILRTDAAAFAQHYYSIFKQRAGNQFGFRLKEAFLGRRRLKNELMQRIMGYSPIAPFILDKANHPRVGAIGYCSCGVPFRFAPEKFPAIRAALAAAAFVQVRDFPSRDKLKEAGVDRDIEVAPDLIVALSDFHDREKERQKGLALLAAHGVDTAKDIICFQSCPQPAEPADELLRQLVALKKKTGAEIVLLPLGYCHADEAFLKRLAGKSSGVLKCIGVRSIHAMIAVIAAGKLFVGTSLHGNITAFSFGQPHLFGPIAVDKAKGFLDVVGLGAGFKLESWSRLTDKSEMVMRLPSDHFAIKAATAKRAVDAAFGKMARVLKGSVPLPER